MVDVSTNAVLHAHSKKLKKLKNNTFTKLNIIDVQEKCILEWQLLIGMNTPHELPP